MNIKTVGNINKITPVMPEGLSRDLPNSSPLIFKSDLIGNELIAIKHAQIQIP